MRYSLLALAALSLPAAADAEELRSFCGDRPGLGTPACTVDPGHLQIELGLGDWTLDKQPDMRTDTIVSGDVLARYGLTKSLEARVGWTAFGHVRERDYDSGDVTRDSRVGDVTLGLKQNIMRPKNGHGFTIALLPFVSLPVGRMPVGAGDWGAGLLVPITYSLPHSVQLEFTPELDAAVDQDGHGRHTKFSGVAGITAPVSKTVKATLEYQAVRDRDPEKHETQQLAALSLAWLAQKQLQFDAGGYVGLNHAAPDVELLFGVSHKF